MAEGELEMMPVLDQWLEGYERAKWDSGGCRFIELGHFQNVSNHPRDPRPRKVVVINTRQPVPTVGTQQENTNE
jgi:hypothetical protein